MPVHNSFQGTLNQLPNMKIQNHDRQMMIMMMIMMMVTAAAAATTTTTTQP